MSPAAERGETDVLQATKIHIIHVQMSTLFMYPWPILLVVTNYRLY